MSLKLGKRLHRLFRRASTAAVIVCVCTLGVAASAGLETPSGPVILSLEGKIAKTNAGKEARFDRTMLQALGMKSLKTSNPFDNTVHTYEGVLLIDVLRHVAADGKMLVAYALDGYAVEIPFADAEKFPVLLAMKSDGKEMTVRSKGPIWIIYPIDHFSELKDEKYSSRSIWQLERLIVE